jgi:hypothetical protein
MVTWDDLTKAKKVSHDFIGKAIVDANGRRWLVKGYMDRVDYREEFPYTCHSLDGDFTIWYTVEETVRECIERAKGGM